VSKRNIESLPFPTQLAQRLRKIREFSRSPKLYALEKMLSENPFFHFSSLPNDEAQN